MLDTLKHATWVGNRQIEIDSEGYLLRLSDGSEDFARALALREGLVLSDAHWELIRFLRADWTEHGVQPQVRAMIRHFTEAWEQSAAATTTCTICFRAADLRNRATGGPACCASRASTEPMPSLNSLVVRNP